jgi:hypothetical protein
LMMAGPLLILYEASVWIVHFCGKKEAEDEAEEVADPDEPAPATPDSSEAPEKKGTTT